MSIIGPSLPPKTASDDEEDLYGPPLPPGLGASVDEEANEGSVNKDDDGNDKCLNEDFVEDSTEDDGEMIGPLPPTDEELRGNIEKPKLWRPCTLDEKPKREEWMTVPGKKVAKSISFKSVTSFARKAATTDKIAPCKPSKKEKEVAKALDEFNKNKRPASLLDIHKKKKSKNELEADKPAKRTPLAFDPESDMNQKMFDSKQTRGVIDKAKYLNSRFSAGSSKFL